MVREERDVSHGTAIFRDLLILAMPAVKASDVSQLPSYFTSSLALCHFIFVSVTFTCFIIHYSISLSFKPQTLPVSQIFSALLHFCTHRLHHDVSCWFK